MSALKQQDKEELANEKALSKFANVRELENYLVEIMLRIRPFFENERLEYERQKASYLATSKLICVKGKKTKFEIIKFQKIFPEHATQKDVF